MALDPGILDAAINSNFKNLAEMQVINALQSQNRTNGILEASLTQQLDKLNTLGVTDAAAVKKVTESGQAAEIARLAAAVAAMENLLSQHQQTP